ncbi:hypothetical protein MTO96_011120 [Rhipicephalus appendiculatus]
MWRGVQRSGAHRLTGSAEACIGTIAQPEPEADVTVVLISRKGLHVIVAVLGVTILGCACAVAYSFGNYSKLKKNVEDVRNYIASRRVQEGAEHFLPGEVGMDKTRSATSKAAMPAVPGNGSRVVAGRNWD